MHNPVYIARDALRQPPLVVAWMTLLVAVNAASLWFWDTPQGKVAALTFVLCGLLIVPLYTRFGYAKILGLAHLPWIPLLIYAASNLPEEPGALRTWLLLLMVLNSVSLVIDARDVWLFLSGKKRYY